MKIIGITGTLGAGKGSIVEYLETKGFKHVAVSDTYLAGEAVKRGLVPDRTARRTIANELRAQGPTALMEAVYKLAEPLIAAGENVVIDPQHTVAEVKFIQSKGGVVFAVDADLVLRYERIKKRGSAKDNISFEQFSEEQRNEMSSTNPDRNNLGASMAAADYHLTNNGTRDELHVSIEDILRRIVENKVT